MGRANVYLPDDLERRVKAARIPVSEVCQQALLAAVEAAEGEGPRLGGAVGELYRRGGEAGERWARAASPLTLLALVRDQRLAQIPSDQLPESWYSLSEELTTGWEAGFVEAARAVARAAVSGVLASPEAAADERPGPVGGTPADAGPVAEPTAEPAAEPDAEPTAEPIVGSVVEPAAEPVLGDGSSSYLGADHAGRRVAFDPHAAVADDKSPLFAVLGPADQRARLALTIAQDAARRGSAVVILDLSGQLTPRARGLGRIVRLPSAGPQTMPGIDALLGSGLLGPEGGGVRGLWDVFAGLSTAGGSLFPTPGRASGTPGSSRG